MGRSELRTTRPCSRAEARAFRSTVQHVSVRSGEPSEYIHVVARCVIGFFRLECHRERMGSECHAFSPQVYRSRCSLALTICCIVERCTLWLDIMLVSQFGFRPYGPSAVF